MTGPDQRIQRMTRPSMSVSIHSERDQPSPERCWNICSDSAGYFDSKCGACGDGACAPAGGAWYRWRYVNAGPERKTVVASVCVLGDIESRGISTGLDRAIGWKPPRQLEMPTSMWIVAPGFPALK